MKKSVVISLVGSQRQDSENDKSDKVELITEGNFYKKGDDYYITYKESEITGMEGTTTTLKIQGEKITMMRFGTNNTQLIFEKGQHHICCYDTQFGAVSVGVWSKNVKVDIDENGGSIYADYSLDIDNNAISQNDFNMQIKECHL